MIEREADAGKVTVNRAALEALWRVYDCWWNEVGTLDPGHVLVSDGAILTNITGLLSREDHLAMDSAAESVEPHVPVLLSALKDGVTEGKDDAPTQ